MKGEDYLNLENLYVGQVIKNYKELCKLVEWEVKDGSSKKCQLRILGECTDYHKEGQKFIIDAIYKDREVCLDMRGKQDNNTPKYVENVELNVIGELLSKGTDGKYTIGSSVLLRNVGLTNVNYSYCKRRQDKLASYLEINQEIVNDYYNCVDSMLLGNLEKALKNLSNKKLIDVNVTSLICKNVITNVTYEHTTTIDEYDEEVEVIKPIVNSDIVFVEATDEERALILKVENSVITQMGYEKISDIFARGLTKKYYNKCYKELRKYLPDLNFYFKAYNIIYSFDKLVKVLEKLGYEDWTKELKQEQQELVNNGVMDRIISNAEKRQNRIDDTDETNKYYYRKDENYIPSYINLNNNVINIQKENIRDKVKEVNRK